MQARWPSCCDQRCPREATATDTTQNPQTHTAPTADSTTDPTTETETGTHERTNNSGQDRITRRRPAQLEVVQCGDFPTRARARTQPHVQGQPPPLALHAVCREAAIGLDREQHHRLVWTTRSKPTEECGGNTPSAAGGRRSGSGLVADRAARSTTRDTRHHAKGRRRL